MKDVSIIGCYDLGYVGESFQGGTVDYPIPITSEIRSGIPNLCRL